MVVGKKTVRRARKSLIERRLHQCHRELSSNFEKVEMRKYKVDKARRAAERARSGNCDVPPMPPAVFSGGITEELFRVECMLHARANLPPPLPPLRILTLPIGNAPAAVAGKFVAATPASGFRVGMVDLSRLAAAVRRR